VDSNLLSKAQILFKKFEGEKAILIQRAYRKHLARSQLNKRRAARKVIVSLT